MPPLTANDLTRRREALGLSQAELAVQFGVHPMTISKWERDLHRIPEMVDLALTALEHPVKRRRPRSAQRDADG